MNNFIQPGETMTHANVDAVVSGQAVLVGDVVAVACSNYAAGEQGEYKTEGVFALPKAAGDIAQGARVALVDGAIAPAAVDALAHGWAFVAAADADATVQVKLGK